MEKINNGNVYEIKLEDNYAYVCMIVEYGFGVFDIISDKPIGIKTIEKIKFRNYRSCEITGITNGDWKLIGKINLEENNIQYPKLIIFENWRQEFSLKERKGIFHGKSIKINREEYMNLLEKGYIYRSYKNYKDFELWIKDDIEREKARKLYMNKKYQNRKD
jgi:hypothetical protein